jgi:hypothetical protein
MKIHYPKLSRETLKEINLFSSFFSFLLLMAFIATHIYKLHEIAIERCIFIQEVLDLPLILMFMIYTFSESILNKDKKPLIDHSEAIKFTLGVILFLIIFIIDL